MTQLRARPPYFILFGNQLDALPASYERFLVNGLRQAFDLQGVPIRISKKNQRQSLCREKITAEIREWPGAGPSFARGHRSVIHPKWRWRYIT